MLKVGRIKCDTKKGLIVLRAELNTNLAMARPPLEAIERVDAVIALCAQLLFRDLTIATTAPNATAFFGATTSLCNYAFVSKTQQPQQALFGE